MIELYTSPTPNGHKYHVLWSTWKYLINLKLKREGQQFTQEFSRISSHNSSNNRYPNNSTLSESGAILIYLAEKRKKLLPKNDRYHIIQWLMFQMAHIGPMMGQANVFYRYLDEKIDIAINRYHKECRRLFEVLNNHLETNEYLVNDFSIADIANWCWIRTHKWSGIDISGLTHLQRWLKNIYSIKGMTEGLDIPITQEEMKRYYQSKLSQSGNNIVIK